MDQYRIHINEIWTNFGTNTGAIRDQDPWGEKSVVGDCFVHTSTGRLGRLIGSFCVYSWGLESSLWSHLVVALLWSCWCVMHGPKVIQNSAQYRSESNISHEDVWTCTGPQPQSNSPPFQKRQYYTRGQVSCKNVLPTLGEKHKKEWFLRSMGSIFLRLTTPLT